MCKHRPGRFDEYEWLYPMGSCPEACSTLGNAASLWRCCFQSIFPARLRAAGHAGNWTTRLCLGLACEMPVNSLLVYQRKTKTDIKPWLCRHVGGNQHMMASSTARTPFPNMPFDSQAQLRSFPHGSCPAPSLGDYSEQRCRCWLHFSCTNASLNPLIAKLSIDRLTESVILWFLAPLSLMSKCTKPRCFQNWLPRLHFLHCSHTPTAD